MLNDILDPEKNVRFSRVTNKLYGDFDWLSWKILAWFGLVWLGLAWFGLVWLNKFMGLNGGYSIFG